MTTSNSKINYVELAIKTSGGVSAVARHFKIYPSAVKKWSVIRLPAERVIPLEALSGISRSLLRPDIYPPAKPEVLGRRLADKVGA